MEKKNCLIIKSNLINALLPDFLKHLWYNLAFTLFLGLLYFFIGLFYNWTFDIYTIFYLVGITLFLSFLAISIDLVRISNTKYRFYARHLEYHYSFIKENTHSINYSQISDIEVRKTLWDKLCGVGNLIIHTSNEDFKDPNKDYLVIKDIRAPDYLKQQIMGRIHL